MPYSRNIFGRECSLFLLQESVPLRHLLNEETLFMTRLPRWRSSIKEVLNDLALNLTQNMLIFNDAISNILHHFKEILEYSVF